MTSPIPEGFHTVTPYLIVDDARGLLEFILKTFDAVELERIQLPDGTVKHAQVMVGTSPIMMGQAQAGFEATPCFLHLYVEDADALYETAIANGAESVREMIDEYYGDRSGGVKDPFGNTWWIATHQEDVSQKEIERRMAAQMGQ